jgi:hypothetical protein
MKINEINDQLGLTRIYNPTDVKNRFPKVVRSIKVYFRSTLKSLGLTCIYYIIYIYLHRPKIRTTLGLRRFLRNGFPLKPPSKRGGETCPPYRRLGGLAVSPTASRYFMTIGSM